MTSVVQAPYDLVFVDAFDGDNNLPGALIGEAFGKLLASVLDPGHGAVIMNVHGMWEVGPFLDSVV